MGLMDKLKDLLDKARKQGRTKEEIKEALEQAAEKSSCIPAKIKQPDGTREDTQAIDELHTYKSKEAADALTYAAKLFGIPTSVLCGVDTTGFEELRNGLESSTISYIRQQARQQSNNYRRMHKLPMKRRQAMRRVDRYGKTGRTDSHRKDISIS